MDELRRQFEHFKQGTMSVTKYEMKFTKLAEYAPNLIPTEREKVRRFIEGLNPLMEKDMTSYQDEKTYLQVVNIATRKEDFDKIAREARDNIKKARTTGIYSGFSVGGKNMNHSAHIQSTTNSSPYPVPLRHGQQSKGQAPQRQSSTSQGQPWLSYPICPSCSKRHLGKCLLGQKGCFHCRDPGHIKRDCPLLGQAPGKTPTRQTTSMGNSIVSPPPVRASNNHTGRGANRDGA
ncbi:uncharacterized protein [Nicotiana tomentosiformis]|uniref:uncharacterized protein n=1 Tax=Nicotiana tomentosiformis TaxID=4098 RepID=UPI00051C8FCF|nr:uncharacterized protein LOC117278252 [Nicotiana tomentosiformis]